MQFKCLQVIPLLDTFLTWLSYLNLKLFVSSFILFIMTCLQSSKKDSLRPPNLNCVMVQVFYVDYGNTEWVKRKRLYPLPEQFKSFPAQVSNYGQKG